MDMDDFPANFPPITIMPQTTRCRQNLARWSRSRISQSIDIAMAVNPLRIISNPVFPNGLTVLSVTMLIMAYRVTPSDLPHQVLRSGYPLDSSTQSTQAPGGRRTTTVSANCPTLRASTPAQSQQTVKRTKLLVEDMIARSFDHIYRSNVTVLP